MYTSSLSGSGSCSGLRSIRSVLALLQVADTPTHFVRPQSTGQRECGTEGQTATERERERERPTDRPTDRQTDTQTDGRIDRRNDRQKHQTDRQTHRHTDRHAHAHTHTRTHTDRQLSCLRPDNRTRTALLVYQQERKVEGFWEMTRPENHL